MYSKQYTGVVLVNKSAETPRWVKWVLVYMGKCACLPAT